MYGTDNLLSIFGIMDGNDVAPTELIIAICSVIIISVITLTIILAKKNKPKN